MNIKRWLGVIFVGSFIGLPAYSMPISIEQSSAFASTSINGCIAVRFGGGAPSSLTCGSDADSSTGILSSGAGSSLIGDGGRVDFGVSFNGGLTDDGFSSTNFAYWSGFWFEGNLTASVGWNSIFTTLGDVRVTASGPWPTSSTLGGDSVSTLSLFIRDLGTGELVSLLDGGSLTLLAGNRYSAIYSLNYTTNVVTGGFGEMVSFAPHADLRIEAVPEPGTLFLFSMGLIGIGLAGRKKRV